MKYLVTCLLLIVSALTFAKQAEVEITNEAPELTEARPIGPLERLGTCARYTGDLNGQPLQLEGCVQSLKKQKLKSLCNKQNEEKLFGYTSRALQVKFVYDEFMLGCSDRGIEIQVNP